MQRKEKLILPREVKKGFTKKSELGGALQGEQTVTEQRKGEMIFEGEKQQKQKPGA